VFGIVSSTLPLLRTVQKELSQPTASKVRACGS
jgi:hypothetical protein